ncbi:hypothetical protein L228DRAFT_242408 [Xylona heveae TC161]|uniref:Uncharacterized protein n=1 Tax=Xylona heveae (strain CBS 132557 / TC161) TaxID=1328760 RepID=A0A165JBN5_XYLHT|nr:hypothetical protein L228DRAFT_242408 [Xylona heveae TC161]KZF26018.1 hypothetical protein L228DRAFT_242408 [Xylona heveae TC161]
MADKTVTTSIVVAVIAVIIAVAYFSGAADPLIKRLMKFYFKGKAKAEEKALETMGENKASYFVKGNIKDAKITDDKNVNELQGGIAEGVGGGVNNPLGKNLGEGLDKVVRG